MKKRLAMVCAACVLAGCTGRAGTVSVVVKHSSADGTTADLGLELRRQVSYLPGITLDDVPTQGSWTINVLSQRQQGTKLTLAAVALTIDNGRGEDVLVLQLMAGDTTNPALGNRIVTLVMEKIETELRRARRRQ